MRVLKAIVVSVDKKTGIGVKLESGLNTMIPYIPVHIGQSILVGFDHAKNCITRIINKYKGEDQLESTETVADGEDSELENPEELTAMEGEEYENENYFENESYDGHDNSDYACGSTCNFSWQSFGR